MSRTLIVGRDQLAEYLRISSEQLAVIEKSNPLPTADALLGSERMWKASTIDQWKTW